MSERGPTREELQRMSRTDLQKLAKDHNIKANITSDAIRDALLDELVENRPEPKTADSSLGSSSNPSPTRIHKPKNAPAKPGAGIGKSKPIIGGGSRKPARGQSVIMPLIPPSVVAANPDPKGKGRVKKLGLSGPPRAAVGSKLPIAKTASMESVRTDTGDHDTDVPMIFSDLSPPLRNASHSDSTSLASLSSRVKKLEHAREASRERREKEMEMLRNQLKAAQESINVLVKKNDALKAQVESAPVAATPREVADVLARVIVLEDLFSKMGIGKSLSEPSSDDIPYADIHYAVPSVPTRTEFQTPPNRVDPQHRRTNVLGPAAVITATARGVAPPRTPSPQIRRYSTNPDESPSPTRLPSNTTRILGRPPAETVPTAGSSLFTHGRRRASTVKEGEALLQNKGTMDPPKRGRLPRTMRDGYESDDPPRPEPLPPSEKNESCDEDGSDEKGTPLPALPFSIAPTTSSPHLVAEASTSRPQKRPRARSSKGNARSHPYMKRDVPRGYSSSPGADNESHDEPKNLRDIFGATPDSSRVPPNPFGDGPIPVLTFGRPSVSHSIAETPMPSPSRSPALPVEETPPASRTRFGTEFGTSMKNRFSD